MVGDTESERRRRRNAALAALNPDKFDERGVLKDGQYVTVSLMMMDSAKGLSDEQVTRLRGGAFYRAVQAAVGPFLEAHKHDGPFTLSRPSDAEITAAINRVREHYGDGEATTLEVVLGLAEDWPAQAAWLKAIEVTLAANGKSTQVQTGDHMTHTLSDQQALIDAVANAREAMIRDMTANGSYLPARDINSDYCISDAARIESETRTALARSEMIADLQKAGRA